MYDFMRELLATSLMCCVAISATFAIKITLGKKLSPKAHLYIWIPVVLKLFSLYGSPKSKLSVYNYAPNTLSVQNFTVFSERSLSIRGISFQMHLFEVIWVAGALLTLFTTIYSYLRFVKGLKEISVDMEKIKTISRDAAMACKLKKTPKIIICQNNISPMVIGFLKPKLLLPQNILHNFNEKQLKIVFLHEYMHLKHKDYLLNLVLLFLSVLHWFNPFVWLMIRVIKKDVENVCDERVLRVINADKYLYGKTILDLSEYAGGNYLDFVISPMASNKQALSSRLLTLYTYGKRKLGIAVLPICIIISVSLLTGAVANEVSDTVDVISEKFNPVFEMPIPLASPPPNISEQPAVTPAPDTDQVENFSNEIISDETNQEIVETPLEMPSPTIQPTITPDSHIEKPVEDVPSEDIYVEEPSKEKVYIYTGDYAKAHFSKDRAKSGFSADNGMVRIEVVGISNSSESNLSGYFNVYRNNELVGENLKGGVSAGASQITFSTWGGEQYYSFDVTARTAL